MKKKKIKLNGSDWEVILVEKKDLDAGVWGLASDVSKTLKIRVDLSDRNLIDTAIHECLHAANFQCFSEEFVEETATQIAKVLVDHIGVSVNRDFDV
jgi:hypothetical protein